MTGLSRARVFSSPQTSFCAHLLSRLTDWSLGVVSLFLPLANHVRGLLSSRAAAAAAASIPLDVALKFMIVEVIFYASNNQHSCFSPFYRSFGAVLFCNDGISSATPPWRFIMAVVYMCQLAALHFINTVQLPGTSKGGRLISALPVVSI